MHYNPTPMSRILLIIFLNLIGYLRGDQPLPAIFKNSQTVIHVISRDRFEFEIIRNKHDLAKDSLEKIVRSRKMNGIWMEYTSILPDDEGKFNKFLYLPIDDNQDVRLTSRAGDNKKYKIPIVIFIAHIDDKVEIIWDKYEVID